VDGGAEGRFWGWRRWASTAAVGLATAGVAALCTLGTGNTGGYLIVGRVAGHPRIGVLMIAAGCAALATIVFRRQWSRLTVVAGAGTLALCCLGCQAQVGGIGWQPAQHVLADSPDGRVSVMAYEYSGIIDSWIEFRLRSHRGWRSREVCLDKVADAVPWTVAARFVDARHVELTWEDGPLVNTWVLEIDPESLRVTGSRGCR
jgi:hypothetical protein